MKTFANQAAQGDVWFARIEKLPEGVTRVAPQNGLVVIAHSETGHDHVMDATRVQMYRLPEEIYECFLVVTDPTPLTHLRPFDVHDPVVFSPGVYRIRRQREYTPEGMRRVVD